MAFYLNLFLANWVAIIFVCFVDNFIFKDKLGEHFGSILGLWALISIFSVPAIIIYWIMS